MIDGGVFWGRNPSNGLSHDEKALILRLKKRQFQSAVVCAYEAIFSDDRMANQKLAVLAKKYPDQIIPCAILQPTRYDDIADSRYFDQLRKQGFKAIGFFKKPAYYPLDFSSLLIERICQKASKAGLVVIFGCEDISDAEKAAKICKTLRTPVLFSWLSGRGYHSTSLFILLSQMNKNFYFDVSGLTTIGTLKHLARSIGTGRLFCSSGAPESIDLCGEFLVHAAKFEKKEEAAILGGNLAKIFAVKLSKNSSTNKDLFDHYSRMPKIDTHWHTEGWNLLEPAKDAFFEGAFGDFQCKVAVASSIAALNGAMVEGNEKLFKLCDKNKALYAMVVVDPAQIKESLQEIRKYATHPKCLGIKTIQDLYNLKLSDEKYTPLLREAEKHSMVVMAHIPGMKDAALKHKKLKFICAHSTYGRVSSFLDVPNIYFDLATSHSDVSETQLKQMLGKAADRMIFASDAQLMSPAWTLAKIAEADLSDKQVSDIFYHNALKLFPKMKKDIYGSKK